MLRRALFIFALLLLLVTTATAAVPPTTKAHATRLLPKEEAQQVAHAAANADDADRWSLQAIPPPRTSPGGGIDVVDEPGQVEKRGIDADAGAGGSRMGHFTDYTLIVVAIMAGAAVFLPTEVAEWVDGKSCTCHASTWGGSTDKIACVDAAICSPSTHRRGYTRHDHWR